MAERARPPAVASGREIPPRPPPQGKSVPHTAARRELGRVLISSEHFGGSGQDVGVGGDVVFEAADGAVAAGADAVEELASEGLARRFAGIELHGFALVVQGGLGVALELDLEGQVEGHAARQAYARGAVGGVRHDRAQAAAARVQWPEGVVGHEGAAAREVAHAGFGRQVLPELDRPDASGQWQRPSAACVLEQQAREQRQVEVGDLREGAARVAGRYVGGAVGLVDARTKDRALAASVDGHGPEQIVRVARELAPLAADRVDHR